MADRLIMLNLQMSMEGRRLKCSAIEMGLTDWNIVREISTVIVNMVL